MDGSGEVVRPQPSAEQIAVRNGEPEGGVADISVRKDETVRLVVSSDERDEVHVHGYDRSEEVRPGKPARMRFRADIEGVYEVELENGGIEIAKLEVRP